ncbi:MAG: hypothetical protein LBG22_09605 [Treponema sp.]|jgi:hypothetical protein|nr:hypothetical protein [Treponema sp.]
MNDNNSVFPVFDSTHGDADYLCTGSGLTAKQYAAIHLKVPRSGDPDIDGMIRENRRAEFAGQALRIIIDKDMKFPDSLQHEDWMEYASTRSFEFADALLAEWETETGK